MMIVDFFKLNKALFAPTSFFDFDNFFMFSVIYSGFVRCYYLYFYLFLFLNHFAAKSTAFLCENSRDSASPM